jgi:intein-encoded DNA endonuclease-like protein
MRNKDIIKDYIGGMSQRQVIKTHGGSYTSLKVLLNDNNIYIRNNSESKVKNNPTDELFFDEINTEEKAYILGFLWADGYNNIKCSKIECSLAEQDKDILIKISLIIFGDDRVKQYNRDDTRQDRVSLVIFSERFCERLNGYGLNTLRNSKEGVPLCHIPDDIFHHFIRGLWDGDGSVYTPADNQLSTQFIGSCKLCDHLHERIQSVYDFSINIVDDKSYSFPMKRLNIHGNIRSRVFLDIIYRNATIYSDRKFSKYPLVVRCAH